MIRHDSSPRDWPLISVTSEPRGVRASSHTRGGSLIISPPLHRREVPRNLIRTKLRGRFALADDNSLLEINREINANAADVDSVDALVASETARAMDNVNRHVSFVSPPFTPEARRNPGGDSRSLGQRLPPPHPLGFVRTQIARIIRRKRVAHAARALQSERFEAGDRDRKSRIRRACK